MKRPNWIVIMVDNVDGRTALEQDSNWIRDQDCAKGYERPRYRVHTILSNRESLSAKYYVYAQALDAFKAIEAKKV